MKNRKLIGLSVLIVTVLFILTASGCDLLGIGRDEDEESSSQNDSEELLKESFSNTALTDTDGTVIIDDVSFSKDIKIIVEDPNGGPAENIEITYKQEDGFIALKANDPDDYYADYYYFCNVLRELDDDYNSGGIGELEDGNQKIVVSGTLLAIGLGLSFKAGLDAGDALYNIYDFHIENWDGSTLETTTYTTTVGDVGALIKDVINLSSLPASLASNISLVASGGASFKLKTGINIAKDWATSKIKSNIRNFLIDQTGKLIGDSSEIRITIHHFKLLAGAAFPATFTSISPFLQQETGAIEIELIDAKESEYTGDPVISDIYVYESSGNAILSVTVKPANAGIPVSMSLVGTDGYTQTENGSTDDAGKEVFTIPAGASGVKDTATVSLTNSDFKKIFAWYY